jgi:hypothetical protein
MEVFGPNRTVRKYIVISTDWGVDYLGNYVIPIPEQLMSPYALVKQMSLYSL